MMCQPESDGRGAGAQLFQVFADDSIARSNLALIQNILGARLGRTPEPANVRSAARFVSDAALQAEQACLMPHALHEVAVFGLSPMVTAELCNPTSFPRGVNVSGMMQRYGATKAPIQPSGAAAVILANRTTESAALACNQAQDQSLARGVNVSGMMQCRRSTVPFQLVKLTGPPLPPRGAAEVIVCTLFAFENPPSEPATFCKFQTSQQQVLGSASSLFAARCASELGISALLECTLCLALFAGPAVPWNNPSLARGVNVPGMMQRHRNKVPSIQLVKLLGLLLPPSPVFEKQASAPSAFACEFQSSQARVFGSWSSSLFAARCTSELCMSTLVESLCVPWPSAPAASWSKPSLARGVNVPGMMQRYRSIVPSIQLDKLVCSLLSPVIPCTSPVLENRTSESATIRKSRTSQKQVLGSAFSFFAARCASELCMSPLLVFALCFALPAFPGVPWHNPSFARGVNVPFMMQRRNKVPSSQLVKFTGPLLPPKRAAALILRTSPVLENQASASSAFACESRTSQARVFGIRASPFAARCASELGISALLDCTLCFAKSAAVPWSNPILACIVNVSGMMQRCRSIVPSIQLENLVGPLLPLRKAAAVILWTSPGLKTELLSPPSLRRVRCASELGISALLDCTLCFALSAGPAAPWSNPRLACGVNVSGMLQCRRSTVPSIQLENLVGPLLPLRRAVAVILRMSPALENRAFESAKSQTSQPQILGSDSSSFFAARCASELVPWSNPRLACGVNVSGMMQCRRSTVPSIQLENLVGPPLPPRGAAEVIVCTLFAFENPPSEPATFCKFQTSQQQVLGSASSLFAARCASELGISALLECTLCLALFAGPAVPWNNPSLARGVNVPGMMQRHRHKVPSIQLVKLLGLLLPASHVFEEQASAPSAFACEFQTSQARVFGSWSSSLFAARCTSELCMSTLVESLCVPWPSAPAASWSKPSLARGVNVPGMMQHYRNIVPSIQLDKLVCSLLSPVIPCTSPVLENRTSESATIRKSRTSQKQVLGSAFSFFAARCASELCMSALLDYLCFALSAGSAVPCSTVPSIQPVSPTTATAVILRTSPVLEKRTCQSIAFACKSRTSPGVFGSASLLCARDAKKLRMSPLPASLGSSAMALPGAAPSARRRRS
ncbi:unnamed protein product [Effrenium voratum]|uniref:Uncharacterized protein n=1 Tax=Effrenium voratum TaxID=2562239 RepID=A0AA36HV97_9DINO|nr:unnamed protein product [Effrenium voratum]